MLALQHLRHLIAAGSSASSPFQKFGALLIRLAAMRKIVSNTIISSVVVNVRLSVLTFFVSCTALSNKVSAEELSASVPTKQYQPTIAIIIDDMGHSRAKGLQLISMPHPMTFSFLPGRKHTKSLANFAHSSGKEVMLHAPMETEHGYGLGFGALTQEMTKTEMQNSLQISLASIPFAIGVNNHMGSALTANKEIMDWVMQQISKSPVYFVDSKTSSKSIAAKAARQYNIPALTRDIFLDHEQSEAYVQKQFDLLITQAKQNGTAIAIGHPHEVTIRFLEAKLPELGAEGIALATISGLWQVRNPYNAMFNKVKTEHSSALAFSNIRKAALKANSQELQQVQ